MPGRAEAFTDDRAYRYRSHGGQLTVAQRDGDEYVTTLRIPWGQSPTGTEARDHVSAARRLGMNLGDAERVAADAREALLVLGDDWQSGLGDLDGPDVLVGARVAAVDDPAVFDTVELVDGTMLYRRDDQWPGWVIVGWSDVSKARRYRPTGEPRPFDPHDHDPS